MDSKKKLWFMIAIKSFKTTKPELAERVAQAVIDNIETEEEYEFVRKLLGECDVNGNCNR